MSSALVDGNGSPRGGSASHEADLLHELHEQPAAALRTYALRLTGDQSRAQDVVQETLVQETLLRAWRGPQILDPEHGSQRPWRETGQIKNLQITQPNGPAILALTF